MVKLEGYGCIFQMRLSTEMGDVIHQLCEYNKETIKMKPIIYQ